jgi:hypothetical protein
MDPTGHTTVRDMRAHSGAFQASAFQISAFDTPRLVLDLEDGRAVPVLEIAQRVVDHWHGSIS